MSARRSCCLVEPKNYCNQVIVTDEVIIQEAIRLVEDGVSVTFPVKGYSMLPFIIGGRESVILAKPSKTPEVGTVVLAWVEGSRYVVHRIIKIDGQHITLMGDGNIAGVEHCMADDIKALVTHVVDVHGQRHPLYSSWRQRGAKLWRMLLPFRRYILAIYRRL